MPDIPHHGTVTRLENVRFAYEKWLQSLSDEQYQAELNRVGTHGIGNPT